MFIVFKAVVSGILIALASELAKKSPLWGAILLSIPFTSLLSSMWLQVEKVDAGHNADMLRNVFWAHIPTLLFFVICPMMLRAGINYWVSVASSLVITAIVFFAYAAILKMYGIKIYE